MKYILRSLGYLWPYWHYAAISGGLVVFGTFAALLAPWPFAFLIDYVLTPNVPLPPLLARILGPLGESRFNLMIVAVVAGVLVQLFLHGITVVENYVNTNIEQYMVLDVRSDLFRHSQRLSMSFHDQRRSGMLIYVINSQGDAPAQLVMTIPPMAQSILTLVGMFWILFKMEPTLALITMTVLPFLYYCVGYYVKYIQQQLMNVMGMEGESLSIIHEAISMLRVIVAFGRENHEYMRFRKQGERTVKARVNVTVKETLFSLIVDMITAIGTAVALGVAAWQVIQGRLTIGSLTVLMTYIAGVYKPLETISTTIGTIQHTFIAVRMAFGLLDSKPEIEDGPDAIEISRAEGNLAFQNVSFHYNTRVDTLKNISFEARAGQVIAIVGPTGAGKTSLVSLIPRFYDSKQGQILLDGIDIKKMALDSLRAQISVVLQEPLLFSGSITANIRYGRLNASMEAIIEAAQAANAHDFIMKLPQQYDTELGERGAQLSGGERQRIAVARAFLKNAPILILDEPTSSIDSKTESVILDALDRLMVGRTTFMIAHRLSTIRRADLILVMDHGCLVESGTHHELLERHGLYRQLFDMQTKHVGRRLVQADPLEGIVHASESGIEEFPATESPA